MALESGVGLYTTPSGEDIISALQKEFPLEGNPSYMRFKDAEYPQDRLKLPFTKNGFQQGMLLLASQVIARRNPELANQQGLTGLAASTRTQAYLPRTNYDKTGNYRYGFESDKKRSTILEVTKTDGRILDRPVAMKGLVTMHQGDLASPIVPASLADLAMMENSEVGRIAINAFLFEAQELADQFAQDIHGDGAWSMTFINIDKALAHLRTADGNLDLHTLDTKQAVKHLHAHVFTGDHTLRPFARSPFAKQIQEIQMHAQPSRMRLTNFAPSDPLLYQGLRNDTGGFLIIAPEWILDDNPDPSNPESTGALFVMSDQLRTGADNGSFLKQHMTAFAQQMYSQRFSHLK